MLSRQENDLVTRVGPGTPGGEFMRRYWQPIALAEELPLGGSPAAVRLLGEDLALFRDNRNRIGLLGIHCAHRGADLSYGRIEDGGLRCLYHGWLYDTNGRCLQQPGEPEESRFHEKIRQKNYPCKEVGGLILTYMGPGQPPPIPPFEFLEANEDFRYGSKIWHDCNYLQAAEGNIDPAHSTYLHRQFVQSESSPKYIWGDLCPIIEAEETPFGVRVYSVRAVPPDKNYVRTTYFVFPSLCAIGTGSADGYTVNWHVPVDDEHHWKYVLIFRRSTPLSKSASAQDRNPVDASYRLDRGKHNRYLQDREEMKSKTFTGMGSSFQAHDLWATEGEGAIEDRTEEHLGYADKAIIVTRKKLLKAILGVQEGEVPPLTDKASFSCLKELVVRSDLVPRSVDWRRYWAVSA